MSYGIIEYNADGLPKCEICNKYFNRVLSHVRQKHFMNERDYKQIHGFDVKKGIVSQQSKQKSRDAIYRNYETCIGGNLLSNGKNSRFQSGHIGRTKDMLSEQSRLMLKERLSTPKMKEAMIESGRRLGKSQLGNVARWGNKE